MNKPQGVDTKPRPRITPDNKPLWDGFREKQVRVPHCANCDKMHLPPSPVCPFCLSNALEWRQCSGRGTVSTWVIVYRSSFPAFAENVPYNVVQVELEEGPRLTASLLGNEGPPLIGQKVVACFEHIDSDLTMLHFRPEA